MLICHLLIFLRLLIMKFDSMSQSNWFAHLLKQWTWIQLSILVLWDSLIISRARMKKVGKNVLLLYQSSALLLYFFKGKYWAMLHNALKFAKFFKCLYMKSSATWMDNVWPALHMESTEHFWIFRFFQIPETGMQNV